MWAGRKYRLKKLLQADNFSEEHVLHAYKIDKKVCKREPSYMHAAAKLNVQHENNPNCLLSLGEAEREAKALQLQSKQKEEEEELAQVLGADQLRDEKDKYVGLKVNLLLYFNNLPPSSSCPFFCCCCLFVQNLGATCYMNCLLQCLYANPLFRQGIYDWTPYGAVDKQSGQLTEQSDACAQLQVWLLVEQRAESERAGTKLLKKYPPLTLFVVHWHSCSSL